MIKSDTPAQGNLCLLPPSGQQCMATKHLPSIPDLSSLPGLLSPMGLGATRDSIPTWDGVTNRESPDLRQPSLYLLTRPPPGSSPWAQGSDRTPSLLKPRRRCRNASFSGNAAENENQIGPSYWKNLQMARVLKTLFHANESVCKIQSRKATHFFPEWCVQGRPGSNREVIKQHSCPKFGRNGVMFYMC